LEQLYKESGLLFPDAVKRSLDEARAFHHQIVANRREFLEVEIKRLGHVIDNREGEIRALSDRRATVLQVLQTHGLCRK
jgi:uncharacterized protein YydD (DUF2326 family)